MDNPIVNVEKQLYVIVYMYIYELAIGTAISDLEWPWMVQWPARRAISAVVQLACTNTK